MNYQCVVCGEDKSSSQAFWTKKERKTLKVTCGKCRRLSSDN